MVRKAFIFGIKGLNLLQRRKSFCFIKKHKPWGIILFSRNIKNLNQLKKLIRWYKKLSINDEEISDHH